MTEKGGSLANIVCFHDKFPFLWLRREIDSRLLFLPTETTLNFAMTSLFRQLRPTLRFITKVNSGTSIRGYAEPGSGAVKEMPLTLAAANQVFYDAEDVKQIDVPTFNGVFGILPKHVPILAVLSPGVVTVFQKDGNSKKIFVSSGTLCVNDDSSVQVLAEEAHYLEDIDVNAAKESLTKAQSELQSAPADKKEEAAIGVEIAEAIVKAVS